MNDFVKKTKIFFIMITIAIILLIVLGIYIPMKKQIENSAMNEFCTLCQMKTSFLKVQLDSQVQDAESMSSRTSIKNNIKQYKNGEITLSELKILTADKYADGTYVIDNLIFAKRIVDGKIIASSVREESSLEFDIKNISNVINRSSSSIVIIDGKPYFDVISPILDGVEILGYDYLRFSVDNLMDKTDNHNLIFTITKDSAPLEKAMKSCNGNLINDTGDYVYYYEILGDGSVVTISIERNVLLSGLYDITVRISIAVFTVVVAILVFMYFYLIRDANSTINDISCDRDLYKNYASMDKLTGAFSRRFIEEYVNKNKNENVSCSVALIDLNDFKFSNDKFGHAFGDEILVTLVEVIKFSLKENDAVIRYGGDEFVIIFRETSVEQAQKIIDRIRENLDAKNFHKNSFDFSCGIVEVKNISELSEYINRADEKMYIEKQMKRKNKKFKKADDENRNSDSTVE